MLAVIDRPLELAGAAPWVTARVVPLEAVAVPSALDWRGDAAWPVNSSRQAVIELAPVALHVGAASPPAALALNQI
jgi:hypothetical protein